MKCGVRKVIEKQSISKMAMELYKRAIAEEKNNDIYVAGLREGETFRAFMQIFNHYRKFYSDDAYFFNLLIREMHKAEDDELYRKVMKDVKRI